MPKLQLKNIEEYLQFLLGERNTFARPDYLEKTRLYITKKIESFNFSVNQETVDFENSRSFNIIGKPADISSASFETLDIESSRKNADAVAETLKTLLEKK